MVLKVLLYLVVFVVALVVLSLFSGKYRKMYASSWRMTREYLKPLLLPGRARRAQSLTRDAGERRQQTMALAADVTKTLSGAKLRGIFAGRKRRAAIKEEASERASAQAVQALGEMKGFMLKLGQMASYMGNATGESQAQLATLQSAAPPMDLAMVDGVIERELGAAPSEVFTVFDAEPLAAASVGQVHRAKVGDRDVVVKVQYPGVDEAIIADLDNFASMADSMGPYWKTDTSTLLAELGSMRQEFDYHAEARNQQHFADLYRGHRWVQIPEVVHDRSAQRVLTSELIDGRRFAELIDAPQDVRNRAAEIIYRFAFGSVLNGFFSGDPHPGNYLFPADGRVCFIDFGVVQRMEDEADRRATAEAIQGGFEDDPEKIRTGLRTLGLLPERGADAAKMWAQLRPLVVGPIDQDRVTRIDRDALASARREASRLTSELAKYRKSKDIHGWVLIWLRYAMGTQAVISQLEPEANWHRIMREIVAGDAPSTEIGETWGAVPGGSAWARAAGFGASQSLLQQT